MTQDYRLNTTDQSRNKGKSKDWKEYWKNTELVPSKREDKQLPWLIDTLKKELDINKIETVLEVGVGYGRVAKAILDTFPKIEDYHGVDISERAWNQSCEYLKGYEQFYAPPWEDFIELDYTGLYDLVISVETMSCVPESEEWTIQMWIDKMCSLSKKYVVNLDYVKTTHPIFNNGHMYNRAYLSNKWNAESEFNKDIISYPFSSNEKLFIFRVR